MALIFQKAFKIYATRWTIEVYFKEAKQHLGLGKCESLDFDAQIAHTTLCMLQYNILTLAKRFQKYETWGDLFREATENTLEITISERIWLIISEIITKLTTLLDVEPELLMENIITENENVMNLINLKHYLKSA